MKSLTIATTLLSLWVTQARAGIQCECLDASAVSPCVAPLEKGPDVFTAGECVTKLRQLSATQTNPSRTATEQMANLIENLFEAEQRLTKARMAVPKAEQDAKDEEVRARHWLERNVFGSNQPNLYRNAVKRAQQSCANAADSLAAAREHFTVMTSATASTVRGLEQAGLKLISQPISSALRSVVDRSKQPLPGEDAKFSKDLAGGLALLGLIWAGSKMLSDGGGADASNGNPSVLQTQQQQQTQQQRRLNNEAEEARQREAAEQRAIDAQHRAWEAERNRPFN